MRTVSPAPERYLSGTIARFVRDCRVDGLPGRLIAIARQHLLDTIGCCLAAKDLDTSKDLAAWLAAEGGAEQATAIGVSRRLPAPQAAFVNGLLARSLEYDDMAMPDLHPSGVIVPVVLAIGEWQDTAGAELLTAIVLGLELCIRIGRAGYDADTRTSRFLQRGQAASAICGAVAGAAVAARLLGLDAGGIADAMGIAVSLASGSLVHGPVQAFEGRYGFYRCFLDGAFDPVMLGEELGRRWEVCSLRFKPYPSNYYTHAGIDAALALARRGLKPEQVQSGELAVAAPMLRTMGEPLARKQAPQSAYEAKFSGPHTGASAMIGGTSLGLGIDDFTDALVREPRRAALMRHITIVADPRCDAVFPDQAPAVLTVVTAAGEQLSEAVMVNRGGPDRPLDDSELAAKFIDCAKRAMPADVAGSLRRAIEELPGGSAAVIAELARAA